MVDAWINGEDVEDDGSLGKYQALFVGVVLLQLFDGVTHKISTESLFIKFRISFCSIKRSVVKESEAVEFHSRSEYKFIFASIYGKYACYVD